MNGDNEDIIITGRLAKQPRPAQNIIHAARLTPQFPNPRTPPQKNAVRSPEATASCICSLLTSIGTCRFVHTLRSSTPGAVHRLSHKRTDGDHVCCNRSHVESLLDIFSRCIDSPKRRPVKPIFFTKEKKSISRCGNN